MKTDAVDLDWDRYEHEGFLRLGSLLNTAGLQNLQWRIDDIMLGRADLDYNRMLMQLDSPTGDYSASRPQSKGFKGPTLAYRKIQDLEHDPLFRKYLSHPVFHTICRRVYGPDVPIAVFRAMFMNKPAERGTFLPWHQDRWSNLDRDPLITVWTALDDATRANGCVEIIPGSHRNGVINPAHPSAFLTEDQASEHAAPGLEIFLELPAGESVLLHNWLLHRSGVNETSIPRRAFSVCYMDARTISSNGGIWNPVSWES